MTNSNVKCRPRNSGSASMVRRANRDPLIRSDQARRPIPAEGIRTDPTRPSMMDVEFFNMVKNGTFIHWTAGTTSQPTAWTAEGSPTIAQDTVEAGHSSHSCKITAAGAANEGSKQTLSRLKASTVYRIRARVKCSAGDTARILTTGAAVNADTEMVNPAWRDVTALFVTDSTPTSVVLKIVAKNDTDIVWFDDLQVTESSAELGYLRYQSEHDIGIEDDYYIGGTLYVDDIQGYTPGGTSPAAFRTITGITNDVVADSIIDTLTLTSTGSTIDIVGTTATDTINFDLGSNAYAFKTITNDETDVVADAIGDTLRLHGGQYMKVTSSAAQDTLSVVFQTVDFQTDWLNFGNAPGVDFGGGDGSSGDPFVFTHEDTDFISVAGGGAGKHLSNASLNDFGQMGLGHLETLTWANDTWTGTTTITPNALLSCTTVDMSSQTVSTGAWNIGGDLTIADGYSLNLQEDITFTGATTENLIKMPDNLADALSIQEGTNKYITFVTSDGDEDIMMFKSVDITHTAAAMDDYTLNLHTDAAAFGDVKALDIDYCTGAIAAGEDEGIILANIAQCGATGGDVFAFEVLATDSGSAGVYGMKVGPIIGPIHQDSGTFANPTTGTDNTVSTDVAAMIDGSTGTTTSIFEADNEYILIGAAAAFQDVEFILTTGANISIKPTFWYSTAGSHQFTQFTPVDGTDGFTHTGVVSWDASDLTGHAVNTDTGTYDIKVIRTRNNLTTDPILGYAKTAATTEFVWDKNGDLSIGNVTLQDGKSLNLYEDLTYLGATTENILAFPDDLLVALNVTGASTSHMIFNTTTNAEQIEYFTDKLIVAQGGSDEAIIAGLAAGNASGFELKALAGSSTVNAAITIGVNNTALIGSGIGATILDASVTQGFDVIKLNNKSYLTLRDFQIIGKPGASTSNLIDDDNTATTHSRFENLYLKNSGNVGMFFNAATSNYNVIYGCEFDNADSSGCYLDGDFNVTLASFAMNSTYYGFASRGDYNTYLGCVAYDNAYYGYHSDERFCSYIGGVAYSNDRYGWYTDKYYNLVVGMGLSTNTWDGAYVHTTGASNAITGVVCANNNYSGVHFAGVRNTLVGSGLVSNARHGVHLSGDKNIVGFTTLIKNGNTYQGAYVESDDNILGFCVAESEATGQEHAVYLDNADNNVVAFMGSSAHPAAFGTMTAGCTGNIWFGNLIGATDNARIVDNSGLHTNIIWDFDPPNLIINANSALQLSAADGARPTLDVLRVLNLEATAGESKGIYVQAGSDATDYAQEWNQYDGTTIMTLQGDGHLALVGTLGCGAITSTGNLIVLSDIGIAADTDLIQLTAADTVQINGNVGIGAAPTYTLDVNSGGVTTAARLISTDAGVLLRLEDDASYSTVAHTTGKIRFGADQGNDQAGSEFEFYIDGTERAVLDAAGNLQIDGKLTETGCPADLSDRWQSILESEIAKPEAPKDEFGHVIKPEDEAEREAFIARHYHNTGEQVMALSYGVLSGISERAAMQTEIDDLKKRLKVLETS